MCPLLVGRSSGRACARPGLARPPAREGLARNARGARCQNFAGAVTRTRISTPTTPIKHHVSAEAMAGCEPASRTAMGDRSGPGVRSAVRRRASLVLCAETPVHAVSPAAGQGSYCIKRMTALPGRHSALHCLAIVSRRAAAHGPAVGCAGPSAEVPWSRRGRRRVGPGHASLPQMLAT